MKQLSLFSQYKIDKPIRLIELFAGIGAQAKALENLNVDFKKHFVCDFDKYAICSYNAIHNTNFKTSDITKIHGKDLKIEDSDKYCYILTYSFPCQDLSLAGKQKGMSKEQNTRSGLLWEVERILKELSEREQLPQVLIMENVPQVVGKRNINDFRQWVEFLNRLGYTSAYQMLNAKDYGIPQNRQRCFMVSILGDNFYEFPEKQKLTLKLKDMLENNVDSKYYLSDKMLQFICKDREFTKGKRKTINRDIACTKTTREANTSPDTSDYISDKLPQNFDLNLLIKENTARGFKEATIGDDVYISGVDKKRGTVQKETIQTLKTMPNDVGVVVRDNYLKTKLCNKLIKEGLVQENDVTRHSYSSNRLNNGEKNLKRVENKENNICSTLDTRCDCLGVVVKDEIFKESALKTFNDNEYKDRDTISTYNQRANDVSVSPSSTSAMHNYDLRIRKLTPLECWRLMGFNDNDFINAKNSLNNTFYKGLDKSNSQLYKQAGNSIVVNVLEAIFKQML